MKKLPKTLFVQRENEGTNDEYFNATTDISKVDDGLVAIYELKEVKKRTTSFDLK